MHGYADALRAGPPMIWLLIWQSRVQQPAARHAMGPKPNPLTRIENYLQASRKGPRQGGLPSRAALDADDAKCRASPHLRWDRSSRGRRSKNPAGDERLANCDRQMRMQWRSERAGMTTHDGRAGKPSRLVRRLNPRMHHR